MPRLRRSIVHLLVLSLLSVATIAVFPATAAAQGVACKDRRAAKKDFNKGRLAYRRGDYEEAILKWQESYALCAEPLIHLNIANAYERLGELKPALDHLRMWRQVAPLREHSELDARIKGMEARIAEQERAAAAAQPVPPPQVVPVPPIVAPPPPRRSKVGPYYIAGFTLLGVGGAAVIAGVVLDVVAATSRPDEAEACTDTDGRLLCREAMRDDIESSNTLALAGDITWIAGAAIAATGGTLLVLRVTGVVGKKKGADTRTTVEIIPWGAGLAARGTF